MGATLIAVADSPFPNLQPAEKVLAELDAEMVLAQDTTPEGILKVARQADGLMVTYGKITAEVIAGLEKCRVIGRMGLGVDNIDIEAATNRGIAVVYVPDYCVDEVSDHAMALLLDLGPQDQSLQPPGARRKVGDAGGHAAMAAARPHPRPGRFRSHSEGRGAQGPGLRAQGHRL